jgi:hypothetical protein
MIGSNLTVNPMITSSVTNVRVEPGARVLLANAVGITPGEVMVTVGGAV